MTAAQQAFPADSAPLRSALRLKRKPLGGEKVGRYEPKPMNDFISHAIPFAISTFGLVVITWLITRRQRSFPLAISSNNPRQEALIALIPTAVLFGLLILWNTRNGSSSPTETYTLGRALHQLSICLICMIPFAITMVIRKQGLQTVGITRHNLIPALLIGIATSLIFIIYHKVSADFWLSSETFFRLVGQLGVGFSEEAIFRGYLQSRFSAWLPHHGWIVVAVIFALSHIPWLLAHEEITDIWILSLRLIALLLSGLSLGWSMKRTGNIVGLSLLHAVGNVTG